VSSAGIGCESLFTLDKSYNFISGSSTARAPQGTTGGFINHPAPACGKNAADVHARECFFLEKTALQ
jgi:hypothetical protein